MAGLLDYVANAMAGGNPTAKEQEYANMARSDADKRKLQQIAIAKLMQGNRGVGSPTDLEALKASTPTGYGVGMPSEAEAARLNQLAMQKQMDEFSRQNAYMSNPQAVQYYQNQNPLGNTMTNILPQGGGMAVRNTQPPMDLNALLRMLGR